MPKSIKLFLTVGTALWIYTMFVCVACRCYIDSNPITNTTFIVGGICYVLAFINDVVLELLKNK